MSYLDSLLTTGFDEDNELIMSENEDLVRKVLNKTGAIEINEKTNEK